MPTPDTWLERNREVLEDEKNKVSLVERITRTTRQDVPEIEETDDVVAVWAQPILDCE